MAQTMFYIFIQIYKKVRKCPIRKVLISSQIRKKNGPKYDELSVKQLWPLVQGDLGFIRYFPDKLPKNRQIASPIRSANLAVYPFPYFSAGTSYAIGALKGSSNYAKVTNCMKR